MRVSPVVVRLLLLAVTASGGGPAARLAAQDPPPGFDESFALAPDRGAVLDQLVPGSPEWFFYRCLHLQQTGDLKGAQAALTDWIARHGRDARVEQMENRQALLAFDTEPAATWAFLRERLGLRFDDRREVPGATPDLPTRLDPATIAPATLLAQALQRDPGTLNGLTDAGLEHLDAAALPPELITSLLIRATRPDRPGLARLVVEGLRRFKGEHFGYLPIHSKLLLAQLEECLRLEPQFINEIGFVEAWLRRLEPGADTDLDQDDAELGAYLERLEAFTAALPPTHNSLKALVLFHRLRYERDHGRYDRERLLAYLRLPRRTALRKSEWLDRHAGSEFVDDSKDYSTSLSPIGDDDDLVRECLLQIFRTSDSYADFAQVLDEDRLRPIFAESKLLYGGPDAEARGDEWYAMIGNPTQVEALRSRVEIAFAPTNRRFFGPDDEVSLDVDLKHVDALLVRVFEIDAFNVYSATDREIDASIALEGLVANEESLHDWSENPLRRVRRTFSFPALSRPGVYIVEFVAGGRASRAVIHKGKLQFTQRVGSAGQVFQVFDEQGRLLGDASLWMQDLLYQADANGEIAVPFSTSPGRRTIILRHGGQCTRATFQHVAESYTLQAAAFVDREALLPHQVAKLLVRPVLRVHGRDASLKLLEKPVLTITATDQDGVASTLVVRDPPMTGEGELVHEIEVPERLATLTVTLSGSVANLSSGKDDELTSDTVLLHLNAIDATPEIAAALLGRTPDGYVLDVLGRSGERLANRTVALQLQHRDFTKPVDAALATDEHGRVQLGLLEGIDAVSIDGFSSEYRTWQLPRDERTWPDELHAAAGSVVRVPAPRDATRPERSRVSLLELRDNAFAIDRFEHVALAGGFYELRDLPPGDFSLRLADTSTTIRVEVTAGEPRDGWIVGPHRMLSADDSALLHVTGVSTTPEELVITVANAGPDARVHVLCTRYLPAFDPFRRLLVPPHDLARTAVMERAESEYLASRAISDEERYVLDRRHARKFPGNMLERPTLLLNPWTIEETETATDGGAASGRGSSIGRAGRAGGASQGTAQWSPDGNDPGQYADLAFLPAPSVTLANLKPGADGLVRVPRTQLGANHLVTVLAVDGVTTERTTLVLPEAPLVPRDLELATALDPARHLTERRRIDALDTGASATIEDVTTSRAEVLDSLASVFRVFTALTRNADLPTFDALLHWPDLPREERLAFLSEHGCHEVHLFLHEHDPALFAEVVAPHLRNKLHKTFLDHWLLEDDLSGYLEPWAFAQLNIVERILLGRRLPEVGAVVSDRLADALELRLPEPAEERRRFDALLRSAELDTAASFGDAVNVHFANGMLSYPAGAEGADAVGSTGKLRAAREAAREVSELVEPENVPAEPVMALPAPEGTVFNSELERDLSLREGYRALYRGPGATREQVEHDYWHRRIREQDGDLIPVNGFWLDFAHARPEAPFVSPHVAEAAGSINEMLLALAVLDLPFTPAAQERTAEGTRLTLRAGGPLLLVQRQLEAAAPASSPSPVVVGQNLFRLDDRWRFEEGRKRERFVTGEFLAGVVYGSLVVLTNPGSEPQTLSVLLQVPEGAVAVGGSQATRGLDVELGPYATTTLESFFYFPRTGDFPHYPVQVARDGELLASAPPATLHVVAEPSTVDSGSWAWLSQNGTDEQVWAFLETANLQLVPLASLAWRLQDPAFFRAAVEWLGRREVYSPAVWKYGLLHRDAAAARTYLEHDPGFVARCGWALRSPLLDIDPIERHYYEHMEYEPLINARAHRFGARREILNESLAGQYARLMTVLAYEPRLDDVDWLSVTYYLLLQDRIEDALAAFAQVDPQRLPGRLQFDLVQAYLDFFTGDTAQARALAQAHENEPVPRWRDRFREILGQLDEAEGRPRAGGAGDDPDALAASEPSLELELDGTRGVLRFAHLDSCELRWFPMDAELLFSRDPFGEQDTDVFATIRPARTEALALDAATGTAGFEVPGDLRDRNVLLEVRGGGLVRRQPRYASALAVQLLETRGQLKVTGADSDRPLPSVYVKVFARLQDGSVAFHKDGYTDLRGRFDYASVSGGSESEPAEFAILVLSETDGTVIRRAQPPAQ